MPSASGSVPKSDAGVSGLIKAALGGCHATVFAYGQTGSGKTHTMEGYQYQLDARGAPAPDFGTDPEALGIVPRAVGELFEAAHVLYGDRCTVECSHVQIYMEQAYDLLEPKTLPQERGVACPGCGCDGRKSTTSTWRVLRARRAPPRG